MNQNYSTDAQRSSSAIATKQSVTQYIYAFIHDITVQWSNCCTFNVHEYAADDLHDICYWRYGDCYFVLPRFANSSAGIGIVFLITGMLGFGLGPILSMYASLPNGGNIITLSLGGTGVIFMGLSAYALATRKDFSFLGGFLMVGFLLVILAALANIFLLIPAMSLM